MSRQTSVHTCAKDATGQKGRVRERLKQGLFLIHLGRAGYLITTLFPEALV